MNHQHHHQGKDFNISIDTTLHKNTVCLELSGRAHMGLNDLLLVRILVEFIE